MIWKIKITELELDFENDFGDNDPDFQKQVYDKVLFNDYEIEIVLETQEVMKTIYNELSHLIGWSIKWVDFILLPE